MDYDTIAKNITDKKYDTKLPFPRYEDEKSGKILKEQASEMKRAWRDDEHNLRLIFEANCLALAETELKKPLTEEQFNALFFKAWEDGHSSGYNEVLICFSDLLDLIANFI